tara:strand:- start:2004 stop:2720 length:717 start_codon:yes stop_codon:yes gene_type:complete
MPINDNYDPFGENNWWESGTIGPTASEVINWDPTAEPDYVEGDTLHQSLQGWLESDWMVNEESSATLAGYLALNPYDPTDEINTVSQYHQNVGTMTNQMSDQLYKQFSDQQNVAASRGFAGAGGDYNRDAAKKTFENTWLTGQYTAHNQMEAEIDETHDEYMDSWWEILLSQENAFTFDPPDEAETFGSWDDISDPLAGDMAEDDGSAEDEWYDDQQDQQEWQEQQDQGGDWGDGGWS